MKALFAAMMVLALLVAGVFTSSGHLVFSLPAYGALAVAALAAAIPRARKAFPPRVLACLGATGVFFAYILVRIVLSPEEYLARADLFMVLGALMLYLLTVLHVTSAKRRLVLVVFLLVLGVANVVVGAIQYSYGTNFMPFGFLQRDDFGIRASGFFLCPNSMAGFLEVPALVGLSIACWSRWKLWARLLIGYLALMCAGGIIMSGSRGGYLSMIVGLIVLAVLSLVVVHKQNKWLYWRVLLGNLLLAGILVFGAERIIAKNFFVQTRASQIATTQDIRLDLWKSGVEQFKLNPVWGTGSRSFLYYGRQFRPTGLTKDPIYTHNDYLQLLAEFGVAGMLGFVLFLATHLRSGFRNFTGVIAQRSTVSLVGSNSLALNVGAMASVAAYMVHSFLDFNLHIPANALMMAFVFGLLTDINGGTVAREKGILARIPALALGLRLSLPALAIWVAVSGLSTLPAEYFAGRARLALCEFDFADCERNADMGLKSTSRNPFLFYYKGEALEGMAETTSEPEARRQLHERAATNFRSAVELFPHEENMVLSLGWALDGLGRFDESEPIFLRALELDPKSPQMIFHYAAHLHLSGRRAEAEAWYSKAHAAGSPSAAYGLQKLKDEDKATRTRQVAAGNAPG